MYITASMVPAILGLHKSVTPQAALRQLVRNYHGAPPEWERTVIEEWDEFQRPNAVFEYMGVTGQAIHDAERFVDGAFVATPDGFIQEQGREDWGVIKIRTPFHRRDISDASGFDSLLEQDRFYAQMQIEMLCTGTKWGIFYQWAPKCYCLEYVEFNEDWVRENKRQLSIFFHGELLPSIQNPADHLAPKRKSFDNAKLRRLISEIDDAREQIAQASAHLEGLMVSLSLQAKGDRTVVCGRNLTKHVRPGPIDVEKLIKNHLPDVDVSPYRGPSKIEWELS